MPDFQDLVSSVAAPVLAGVNTVAKSLAPLANPVMNRLSASGLFGVGNRRINPQVNFFDSQPGGENWKVRIRIAKDSPILYNIDSGLLSPLVSTMGVVFPYTPSITTTYQALYTAQRFTHSNYTHYSYDNSEVQSIQITADFTAQNQSEAQYVLACIYFFRAATKMFFGQGELAGNPPPIVFLNGYGQHYFPDVPCVITSFSHTMPSEVDYIETAPASFPTSRSGYNAQGYAVGIESGGKRINPETGEEYSLPGGATSTNPTRIPTVSQFTLALQPVYSKLALTDFNLNDFAQGRLTDKRFL
jgi:hypothetical protein